MKTLIVLAFVGLFAQLVDGSLGMAYGVTSSSLLLATGIAPAAASAAVHFSEIGTTLVSGLSHWKLGNVDWRTVSIMAVPGGIAAFFGATVLSSLDGEVAKPWVAGLLLVLGAYVLYRFLVLGGRRPQFRSRPLAGMLVPLAAVGGAMDALGGGGWGPVGTSEFVVAVGGSLGFLFALGSAGIRWDIAAALLAGGVVAAPIAAWLVRHLPARILGVAAGGVIVLTNIKTIAESFGAAGSTVAILAVAWTVVWAQMLVVAVRAERRARELAADETTSVPV